MKRWIVAAAMVLGVAPAAWAQVEGGRHAFLVGDYATALQILMPLATEGNAEAEYLLGVMRSQGKGFPRDYRGAAAWYERAARQDHRDAQFSLGFLYYYGAGEGETGVAPDPARAAAWFSRVAEYGYPAAQYYLATLYRAGSGVPKDETTARAWMLEAADGGFEIAQFEAGLLLANGEGGEADRVEAGKWFLILAEKGYPGAAENRDVLLSAMTAEEAAEARRLARAWRPTG